jgi:hypothetical protein
VVQPVVVLDDAPVVCVDRVVSQVAALLLVSPTVPQLVDRLDFWMQQGG